MKTITDYENYVKNNLGIPYVNYKNLDISVAKEMTEAIEYMFSKYPSLKSSICAIGSVEDINNQYNIIKNSSKIKKFKWYSHGENEEDIFLYTANVSSKIYHIENKELFLPCIFLGIGYGEDVMLDCVGVLNTMAMDDFRDGLTPKHCNTFKSYIYHEFGHVLDYILKLRNDSKLYDIIKSKTNNFDLNVIKDKVSKYPELESLNDEIIADCFAEYIMCPYSNDLVYSVGSYIDDKYKKYENSKIFKINNRYKKHRTRSRKIKGL